MDLKQVFRLLDDTGRFYLCKNNLSTIIYDSYVNNFYQIYTQSFRIIRSAVFNNNDFANSISVNKKIHDTLIKLAHIASNKEVFPIKNENTESSIQVMINTGTRCNLNCTYCYRNKDLNLKKSSQQIENEIEYVIFSTDV